MTKRNLILSVSVIIPLIIAIINSQAAEANRLSWSGDNLNVINFICIFVSFILALIMIFLNKEKTIWVWVFAGLFIIFDSVLLLLGYAISNFGF